MPTGRSLHRIWFYIPDARYTVQLHKRASSEYLRAVSGSIELDITVWIEWNFHMRQDMNYSPQDRGNSVLPLNQDRYRADHGGFGYLSQKGYWISPVFFDDDAVQTMRRRSVATTASSG